MHYRQVPNFCHYQGEQLHQRENQLTNANKTLSWSSIKSNYQEEISPLNYKLSNPSSSLVMSSLSHIQQDDVETTGSTLMYQQMKDSSKLKVIKSKESTNPVQNNFYQYLLDENQNDKSLQLNSQYQKSTPLNKRSGLKDQTFDQTHNLPHNKVQNQYVCFESQKIIPANQNKNFTLMNYHSGYSAEQSLIHLEHSQQQLSFLKYKLQEAYEKLEKQILNSYQLEQKNQSLKAALQGKEELIELEKSENEKLKFTLKAIMKNKSFLEEEMQKGENKKSCSNETARQNELKENLRLKLELKQMLTKVKFYEDTAKSYEDKIKQLESHQGKLIEQIGQLNKQCETLKSQMHKKDQYMQTISEELHTIDLIKADNKRLLLKQTQYLNQINVIEIELRKVTDEKVTSVARLKHELAMVQKHNEELMHQNEALADTQRYNMAQSQMFSYSPLPQNQFVAYSPSPVSKKHIARSVNKYSNNNSSLRTNNFPIQHPMIFDAEEQSQRNISSLANTSNQWKNSNSNISIHSNNQHHSMNASNSLNNIQRNAKFGENKENLRGENLEQSFVDRINQEQSKVEPVGKWKKSHSQSNSSSLYIEGSSKQQIQPNYTQENQIHKIVIPQRMNPIQNLINQKLSNTNLVTETQDQKLSKYQLHRKKIENELSLLEKIKRLNAQERQKMQKLQKQLYYIDSDIAGLKRKIRRKY